jgi:two-component sensor histidine kinase
MERTASESTQFAHWRGRASPRRADSGVGGRLVEAFFQQLGGQIERKSDNQGTVVRLTLPSPEASWHCDA